MIRLLFSVGDGVQTPKSFHTLDLTDEKAKLLLQSTAVVIGVENRTSPFSDFLRAQLGPSRLHDGDQVGRIVAEDVRPGGVTATWVNGGNVIPEPLAGEIEKMFSQPQEPAGPACIEKEIPCCVGKIVDDQPF